MGTDDRERPEPYGGNYVLPVAPDSTLGRMYWKAWSARPLPGGLTYEMLRRATIQLDLLVQSRSGFSAPLRPMAIADRNWVAAEILSGRLPSPPRKRMRGRRMAWLRRRLRRAAAC
jgi:hypothetical protein